MSETDRMTLDSVAKSFAHWRSIKKKWDRIPQSLWAQVYAIRNSYSLNEIKRALGISTEQYKRYVCDNTTRLSKHQSKNRFCDKTTFVDVLNPVNEIDNTLQIELTRPDGLTLRCQHSNYAALRETLSWFAGV